MDDGEAVAAVAAAAAAAAAAGELDPPNTNDAEDGKEAKPLGMVVLMGERVWAASPRCDDRSGEGVAAAAGGALAAAPAEENGDGDVCGVGAR